MGFQLLKWAILFIYLIVSQCEDTKIAAKNSTNKDMYVINAMVYQVGILTNKTDNATENANTTEKQEAITFYHTKGKNMDLSKIPEPLVTNVTAQNIVAVAPVSQAPSQPLPWTALENLASMKTPPDTKPASGVMRTARDLDSVDNEISTPYINFDVSSLLKNFAKRSTDDASPEKPRNTTNDKTTVAIVKGSAIIPQVVGVKSLAIPSLLSLNNNMSNIPVPIPNTSVVHYAKINTLVRKP